MTVPHGEVQVERVHGLVCHRCGAALLLAVRVPYSFSRPDGGTVSGCRTVPLCGHCDADDPAASTVIEVLTARATSDAATAPDVTSALNAWIDHVAATGPQYSDADLDADIAAWRQEQQE
jgi:hypothetical protein